MIYIYGAGAYGIHAYYLSKQHGIFIDGFIDQDEKKRGYLLDGISCMSLEDLEKLNRKNEIKIIVCVKKEIDCIIRNIKMHDVGNIYTMKQFQDELLQHNRLDNTSSVKTISSLRRMKESFSRQFCNDCSDEVLDQMLVDIVLDYFLRGKLHERAGN